MIDELSGWNETYTYRRFTYSFYLNRKVINIFIHLLLSSQFIFFFHIELTALIKYILTNFTTPCDIFRFTLEL